MIGRLVLSDRNIFKIKSGNKQFSARKCNILSESHNEILIKTNKEFNSKDEYVKIDPISNKILEKIGNVGNETDDLLIYYHLYTLNWMSNSAYNKLCDKINMDFDLANLRTDYLNKVITIDPIGSIDLDDGFTFNFDSEYYYLDIHISDPISLFDFTNPVTISIINELFLRLQTCYINSKLNYVTHLLPTPIVNIVSLLEINDESKIKFRRAISFCFKISRKTLEINFNFKFTKLTNIKNYTYENYDNEINLQSNFEVKTNLVDLANKLINITQIKIDMININNNISHKIIEIFMILLNLYGGNYLTNNLLWKKTILRTQDITLFENDFNIDTVPKYAHKILSKAANYIIINNNKLNKHHTLGICNYAHISSPMRRFVDLINHLGFYQIDLELVEPKLKLLYDMNYINTKIKKYKKISNSYDLLNFIKNNTSNKFKGCLINWELQNNINKIKCLFVLYNTQYDFVKIIQVELPQTDLTKKKNLIKYMEFDIELYYNSNNFKSNNFPFSIKILN